MDKKIIALIPARGGSKGIPKKNIRKFLDLPLIVHSINYALSCKFIDEIYVTTDNMEIAEIAIDAGAKIIDRPKKLALDESTTESAIEHALDIFKLSIWKVRFGFIGIEIILSHSFFVSLRKPLPSAPRTNKHFFGISKLLSKWLLLISRPQTQKLFFLNFLIALDKFVTLT